jgi:hypothetical protein
LFVDWNCIEIVIVYYLLLRLLHSIRAGTGPAGPDRFRRSTGPEKNGNSPVELLKKILILLSLFVKKCFMTIGIKYMKCYAIDISIQNI